ncbi:unnamed protein product [Caenorhabditis auriculariae]|uniref:MARVEL domain-containing protein n=1 Tax=Caenorhabditis auriculariae TaxID=2777116 RepID=A0A8S1HNE4_9PELO|nr:unnamed protein product [Caenorhabditis auriculariae]
MRNLRFESHRNNGGAAETEFNWGEFRRAEAIFQEAKGMADYTGATQTITVRNPDGTTETKLMLRSDEEHHGTTAVDLEPVREVPHSDDYKRPHPPPRSPVAEPKKKLQFHMNTSKIQIIPNNRQGQLNTGYLATIGGVLKIAEIVLSFIAFVLAICADRRTTTAAWTEHITFETLLVVTAFLLGYVCFPHLTIKDEPTREGLIVVELLFYGVNTVLYFISIWLMVHLSASWGTDGRGAAIMSAVICVALTVLFAIETFLKLKAWRGENEPSSRVITTGNTPA